MRRTHWIALALLSLAGLWVVFVLLERRGPVQPTAPDAAIDAELQVADPPLVGAQPEDSRTILAEERAEIPAPAGEPAKAVEHPAVVVVVDDSEAPVAGATVEITDEGPLGVHTADAAGRCPLPIAIGSESVQLRVEAEGFVPMRIRYSRSPEIRLTLHRAIAVHGRVVNLVDGAPIPGAKLRVDIGVGLGGAPPQATTGPDGAFEIEGIPERQETTWTASADAFATRQRKLQVLKSADEVKLELEPGIELAFEVVDAQSGAPLAGARLDCGGVELSADAQGRIVTRAILGESETQTRFRVTAAGHCTLHARASPTDAVPGKYVRLPLLGASKVEVFVTTAEGAPIPGAAVLIDFDYGSMARREQDRARKNEELRKLVALPEGWIIEGNRSYERQLADERGRVLFDDLEPWSSSYRVTVASPERNPSVREVGPTGGPGQATSLTVVLQARGAVGVVAGIVTINGSPCSAIVEWKGPSRDGSSYTEPDGSFRFEDAECGPVKVIVHVRQFHSASRCDGLIPAEWKVEVRPDQEAHLDIPLEIPLSLIQGRVLRADGQPAQDVPVQSYSRDSCWEGSGQTGADGRFSIEVDPGVSDYEVSAGQEPDRASLEHAAPGARDLELVLPGAGRLRVLVLDRATDAVLNEFSLELKESRGAEIQVDSAFGLSGRPLVPDAEGWRTIELAVGRYELLLTDSRTDDSEYLPATASGIVIAAGTEPTSIRLYRDKGSSVSIELEPGQEPWKPAEFTVLLLEPAVWPDVELGPKGWHLGPAAHGIGILKKRRVALDSGARARLTGLPAGTYSFKVFPPGLAISPEEITVPLPTDGPVRIRWTRN